MTNIYDDNGECIRIEIIYNNEMNSKLILDTKTGIEYLAKDVGGVQKPISQFIPWIDKFETLHEQAEALIDDGFITGSAFRDKELSPNHVCLHFAIPPQIPPQKHDLGFDLFSDLFTHLATTWHIMWTGTTWELLFLIYSYISCGSIPKMKPDIVYDWIVTHFIRLKHEKLTPFTVGVLSSTKSRAKTEDTKIGELLIEIIQSSYGTRFDIDKVYMDIFQGHS